MKLNTVAHHNNIHQIAQSYGVSSSRSQNQPYASMCRVHASLHPSLRNFSLKLPANSNNSCAQSHAEQNQNILNPPLLAHFFERLWPLHEAATQRSQEVSCASEACRLQDEKDFDHGGIGGNQGGGNSGESGRRGGRGGGGDGGWGCTPDWTKLVVVILLDRFWKRDVKLKCVEVTLGSLLVAQWFFLSHRAALAESSVSGLAPSRSKRRGNTLEIESEGLQNGVKQGLLDVVWEVKSGQWRRLVVDPEKDEFVIDVVKNNQEESQHFEHASARIASEAQERASTKSGHFLGIDVLPGGIERNFRWCLDTTRKLMLPEGYPATVTEDYLEYTLWRMVQGIASQINGVLTTQALLYAVGLGKGAIPTAAAVNWVLKDGIGYLSKIMLSKYGRHFDVHPKGWRLLADLLENASSGLELLTPIFPHLFVYLGAAAGAGRSASGLIQAATRSCFYAGFAAQRNFADVIAKGEAQGMVSKSLGIMLGIAMSSYVGSSGPALVAAFAAVTAVHMFCNLKSYQAVQLRTLNPYRASLVFGEYLRSGVIPSIREVNAEEPIFTGFLHLTFNLRGTQDGNSVLSEQTKHDAALVGNNLELGVPFGDLIQNKKEADALFQIYQNEQYILAERENRFLVLLKEGANSHDLLRMMLQVSLLCQLKSQSSLVSGGIVADCQESGNIKISHDHMEAKFLLAQQDLASAGWVTDGLVSRPLPNRLVQILSVNH